MKKGITATSVAIMVVIVMMLVGTITTLSYNSIQNAKKTVFALEISSIQEAVDKYVSDSVLGEYPTIGNEYLIDISGVSSAASSQFDEETKTANNEIAVYEVDLSILGITDTVYGNKNTDKDVYVLSKGTGRVYYLEGIKLKSTTYYTLTEDLLELKAKKIKSEEESPNGAPVISTDGYVSKTLSSGNKEVYLSNIKVTNSPKIFKYELGIISEDDAKEYFKNNGKSIVSDRLKFDSRKDITLYAENSKGEYDIKYCYLLQDNAAAAINAGLKIGDIVTGYSPTVSSVTSSGKENTAPNGAEETAHSQTITKTAFTTWRYIGISDDGLLEIAPDMISDSISDGHMIVLSGKGGYLYGASELNNICKTLYSTSKGTARSMNIDDVTEILEYTGGKGTYVNNSGVYIDSTEPKSIGEILSAENIALSDLFGTSTPDDEDITKYYSNYYGINSTYSPITSDTTRRSLVFFSNIYYWLASSCVFVDLTPIDGLVVRFGVREVYDYKVAYETCFFSTTGVYHLSAGIRPVVTLNSTVTLTKQTDGSWSI